MSAEISMLKILFNAKPETIGISDLHTSSTTHIKRQDNLKTNPMTQENLDPINMQWKRLVRRSVFLFRSEYPSHGKENGSALLAAIRCQGCSSLESKHNGLNTSTSEINLPNIFESKSSCMMHEEADIKLQA
jgi:hypothetical protein